MPRRHSRSRYQVAEQVHAAAIHLLRRLRRVDEKTGLSGPKLSALSVLVFGGPRKLGELADAEQVRPATMSRLVQDLVDEGLVTRVRDKADARAVRIEATARAAKLLQEGRSQRLALLDGWLKELSSAEVRTLREAAEILARLGRPPAQKG